MTNTQRTDEQKCCGKCWHIPTIEDHANGIYNGYCFNAKCPCHTPTNDESVVDEIEEWNAECGLFDDTPMSDYMEKKRTKEYRDGLLAILTTTHAQHKAEVEETAMRVREEEANEYNKIIEREVERAAKKERERIRKLFL